MILVEYRESVYNKAFELIEEAKKSNKMTKMALCDLYECLQDCYESDMDENIEDEYEDIPAGDENTANIENVDIEEINYRGNMRRNMRDGSYMGMRSRSGMRSGMRRNMRRPMRRSMGRYSY